MNKSQILSVINRSGILGPKQIIPESMIIDETVEAKLLLNYRNNILRIVSKDRVYFFRESKIKLREDQFIRYLVEDFFKNNKDNQLYSKIYNELVTKSNYKQLINMGVKGDPKSNISNYLRTGDTSKFGFDLQCFPKDEKLIREFIFYCYGEINARNNNLAVKPGQYEDYNACRCACTKVVADLLGLEYLIPTTKCVTVNIGGIIKKGTIQDEVKGINIVTIPLNKRQEMLTSSLYYSLLDLNILDVICYEKDHRPNNYSVIVNEKGQAVQVCAFDNDAPMTFYVSPKIGFNTYVHCSPIIDKNGIINRPCMDVKLATRILNVDIENVVNSCKPFLTSYQIFALTTRVKKLRSAIQKTSLENKKFLVDRELDGSRFIREELTGKYGKTYLNSFLKDCYFPDGFQDQDKI